MLRTMIAPLVLFACASFAASPTPSLETRVDELFATQVKPGDPGAVVGIYKAGQVVFAKGYGLADVEAGTPITTKTRFHVASVSKEFTGFAIALLAREGKVDLDADVRTYLPYVPDFGYKITARHLLTHTSGLRDQWSLFELGGKDMRDVLRQEHVVSMVTRQRALNFPPGSAYSYSNTGFTLLAEIVRAVSGKTLREFTTERMFKPLGMNSTFFFDDVRELVPGRANSYEREKDGPWLRSLLSYQTAGATSLFTTIEDLAKWSDNFSHPRVGDAALLELFTRSGTLNDGSSIHYAFGLSTASIGGRKTIGHSGADAGFRTDFAFYPEYDVGIAVLSNAELDVRELHIALANIYLPASSQEAKAATPAILKKPPAKLLASLPGAYLHDSDAGIVIAQREGKLFARWYTQDKELVFRQDGSFDLGSRTRSYLRPIVDAKGAVTALENISVGGAAPVKYARVTPKTSTPAELASYAGDYHSDELDITYSLSLDGGQLVSRTLWSAKPLRLTQVTADHFDTDDWQPHAFDFQRNAAGQIEAALIHSSRTINVRLRRLPPGVR